jgi:hypothetical protein
MNTRCPFCDEPVLVVAFSTTTRTVEPKPDPEGTIEIRRSGGGWRGQATGANTPLAPGWVSKHRSHSCKQPLEASND